MADNKYKPSQNQLQDLAEFSSRLDESSRNSLRTELSNMNEKQRLEAIQEISRRVHAPATIKKGPSGLEKLGSTVRREVVSPIAQGLNMAAFGIPQTIMRKANPELSRKVFEQPRSLPGVAIQGASQLAGLVGGGPGILGKLSALKALPKMKSGLGLVNQAGDIAKFKRMQDLRTIGRAAIEGGVIGGTTITDDKGDIGSQVTQQGIQATGGALTGAAFGAVGRVAKSISRGLNKKVPVDKRGSPFSFIKPKVNLSKRISRSKSDIREQADDAIRELTETTDAMKQNVDDQIRVLNSRLKGKTVEGARQVQDDLISFNKQMTEAYGSTLDDISEYATSNNVNPRLQDVDDMFTRTLMELEESGLDDEQSYKVISKFAKKYRIVTDEQLSILDDTGKPIQKVLDPNKSVPFIDLQKDMKKINKVLSASAKGGGRSEMSDVGINILRRNSMDMLMQTDDELVSRFGGLQNSYSDAVDIVKEGYKVFKPGKGRIGTKQGEGLLRRVSKADMGSEVELMKSLESGADISGIKVSGIKPIQKELRDISLGIENQVRIKANIVKNEKLKKRIIERQAGIRRRRLEILKRRAEDIESSGQGLERFQRVVENATIGAVAAKGALMTVEGATGQQGK